MWYTGDDSSKKRVAYATSADGVTWAKGGKVISPEDPGVSANIAFGAFAPTVWKTATGYSMLLTGPQARRRRRLPDEDHGHDVDRRHCLGQVPART